MSHYTVLVITSDGDYEKALEPFDENLEMEPYIYKTKEQCIQELIEYKRRYDNHDENFNRQWFNENFSDVDFSDGKSIYEAFRKYHDYYDYDEEGNVLSTCNPNSKWDWYQLGGRWNGSLRLKEGTTAIVESQQSWCSETAQEGYTDYAQVKNVDFTPDYSKMEYYKRFWQINVEGDSLKENEKEEDFKSFWNAQYYLDTYGTMDNYIEDNCGFKTYAILNHGEWIEPGKMGWFGCSHATKDGNIVYRQVFKDIIKNLNPEDYLAVVDCHI